ncbi:DUF5344 family protein [Shouchella lonarensis]|uniref:Uncharacterized protein n=1 Tax=Shouchella lonarensis TaxID=1464122 RepID=A0A1G6HNK2_9BACI|nr:DUF5344 family protein [Shouchella lonarensis]SDB95723.1 hypothetical protein SAMN05421737_10491 [Shouchella lonarensis]
MSTRVKVETSLVKGTLKEVASVASGAKMKKRYTVSGYNLTMLDVLIEDNAQFDEYMTSYMTALELISNNCQKLVDSYAEKDEQISGKIKSG